MSTTEKGQPASGGLPPPAPAPWAEWFPARMSLTALARFGHQVGTAFHAGVDLRRIFETEALRGSPRNRAKMAEVRDRLAAGESLSSSLRRGQGYFPPLMCEMVEVGERTGRIEQVMLRLGEHYDHLLRLRRAFLFGIAWPMIELGLALAVIGLFILILGMVASPGEPPPITFMGLYGTGGFIVYVTVLGLIALNLAAAAAAYRFGWLNFGPLFVILHQVPGLKRGLEIAALSRLTWALAMATDSDLSPQKAVAISLRTTNDPYYLMHLDRMVAAIGRGRELHQVFAETYVYPADFLDALHTGEVSGQVSEVMTVLAKDYQDRLQAYFRMVAIALGTAVFLGVAALIIFFIFQLFAQYMGILNDATKI